ncbi:helix-turn-helix domain-containing protein [Faecalibacterium sp. PGM34]
MRSGRHRLIVLLRRTRRRATQGRLHGKYTLQAARTPEYTRLCPNRTSRGITQEELAVRLGLASKQHVSRMENGKRSCSIDLLIELSCILHVSTDYLLMGSEPSKEEVKNDLLSIISELSRIAKKL